MLLELINMFVNLTDGLLTCMVIILSYFSAHNAFERFKAEWTKDETSERRNRVLFHQACVFVNNALLVVIAMARYVVGLLHAWFPPEPEVRTVYVQVVESAFFGWVQLLDWQSVLLILVIAIPTLLLAWFCIKLIIRVVQYYALVFRGIKPTVAFESIIPGSEFRPAEIPPCQVPIFALGYLSDSFVGFGIRVGEYLVVPTHVLDGARGGRLVLKSRDFKKGAILDAAAITSKVVSDLSYLVVPDTTWVNLQIKSAALSSECGGIVSVVGLKGSSPVSSSGTLAKSQFVGILKYSGSTMPGFSGAAYTSLGRVVGLHTGSAMDHNLGVSSAVFLRELAAYVKREARRGVRIDAQDYNVGEAVAREVGSSAEHTKWTTADIESRIARAREGNWADMVELEEAGIDYEANRPEVTLSKEATEALMKLPAGVVQELAEATQLKMAPKQAFSVPKMSASGQSPDEPTVVITGDVCDERYKQLSALVEKVSARLEVLEKERSELGALLEKMNHFLGKGQSSVPNAPPNSRESSEPIRPKRKAKKAETELSAPKEEPKKEVAPKEIVPTEKTEKASGEAQKMGSSQKKETSSQKKETKAQKKPPVKKEIQTQAGLPSQPPKKKDLSPAQILARKRKTQKKLVRRALALEADPEKLFSPTVYGLLHGTGLTKPRKDWPSWAQKIASALKTAPSEST